MQRSTLYATPSVAFRAASVGVKTRRQLPPMSRRSPLFRGLPTASLCRSPEQGAIQ